MKSYRQKIEECTDLELRAIYEKYWNLRHKVFLNEHGIPDQELSNVLEQLDANEAKEIEEYQKKKSTI